VWSIIERFRDDVADIAVVTDAVAGPRLRELTFQPANPDGAPIRLLVGEMSVVVILGKASLFELGGAETDRRFLRLLLEAAAGGGLREVSDMFGTAYTVRLSDGSTHRGRVLQFAWRRRSTYDYSAWQSSDARRND